MRLALIFFASFSSAFASNSLMNQRFNDENCDAQLGLFEDAFIRRDLWALRLFDTWGKFDSGYFKGNRFSLGRYSDCVNFIQETELPLDNEIIQGQYCLVTLTALSNSTINEEDLIDGFDWRVLGSIVRSQQTFLTNGVCLPSVCSSEKVVRFVNSFLPKADLIAVGVQSCQTNDPMTLNTLDVIAISIYSFFAVLLIISTLYDLRMRQVDSEPNKLLVAFSVYTNGEKLFDITKNKSSNSIDCLNGMRALSVFWIMFGHRFTNQQMFPINNPRDVVQHYEKLYSVVLSAYNIAVDTFFVMGGLLATISTLNALQKEKLNTGRMIFHRYLRYTPVLAALVLFVVSLAKFSLNGPIDGSENSMDCINYWWSTLLHIQNYVNPQTMCLGHTWYLSADFQLFILTPILIFPAWKFGWKVLSILPALALMSSIYILVLSYVYGLTFMPTSMESAQFSSDWIYYATHARIGPWLSGMVLGFVLVKFREITFEISKLLNIVLWITSISVLTIVVVLAQPLNQHNNTTSLTSNAFYFAFHRLAWSLGICWIIFACQKLKTGGIIRWFLSLAQWQPIARMSLSMYLVHPIYQTITIMNRKTATAYEIWPMLHDYWGDIVVTLVLGTILYLTFEAPFLLIESYIYKRKVSK